jgi:hypothetical protein
MSEPAIENLTILSNGYNISVFYQIRKTLLSINELSDFAIILNLSIRTGNGTLTDSIQTTIIYHSSIYRSTANTFSTYQYTTYIT